MGILALTIGIKLVLIPLLLNHWLFWRRTELLADWILRAIITGLFTLWIFFAGEWAYLSYWLRYVILSVFLATLIASLIKNRSLPLFRDDRSLKWWLTLVGRSAVCAFLMVLLSLSLTARSYDDQSISISSPLKNGSFYIFHGGSNGALNYHGIFSQPQTYAMDILELNPFGMRAHSLIPDSLTDYNIFDRPIFAPCNGTVIAVADSLEDIIPPSFADSTITKVNPAGNFVAILRSSSQDSIVIFLAHMKRGSVKVLIGDLVQSGQIIGKVGNTGNTSEPHLHIHGAKFHSQNLQRDSLLRSGEPVVLLINNQFYFRNEIFSDSN